jgi:PAS domain S-box-containing protein
MCDANDHAHQPPSDVEWDDRPLHPEVAHWIRAYGTAADADRDAVVSNILHSLNEHLHQIDADRSLLATECETRVRVLTEQMPAILWSTDNELRVTSSIGGGLANVGAGPTSYVGRSLVDLLGADGPESPPLASYRRALRGQRVVSEQEWQGRIFTVHIEPLRGPTGAIVGTVGAALDVTEARHAARALARREAQLAEAQQLAHLGSWERDLGADIETWSDEYYRIYGMEPQAIPATFQNFLARVHPDDVRRVQALAETAARSGEPYATDFRIVRPNGEVRLIHSRGAFLRDASGRPVRVVGTALDVTERERVEEERALQRERQARLDGMLFAVRELAARAKINLATSSGAIDALQPESGLAPRIRGAIDAAAAGLSEASRAINELNRLIPVPSSKLSDDRMAGHDDPAPRA